eukprot:220510-Rhodomonas_salina.1
MPTRTVLSAYAYAATIMKLRPRQHRPGPPGNPTQETAIPVHFVSGMRFLGRVSRRRSQPDHLRRSLPYPPTPPLALTVYSSGTPAVVLTRYCGGTCYAMPGTDAGLFTHRNRVCVRAQRERFLRQVCR